MNSSDSAPVKPPARVGLGLAAIGRPGYINLGHSADLRGEHDVEAMQARAFEVLDLARASGVVDFDVARSYGRAEVFLADWLNARGIEPGTVRVSSKWGYTYTADWKVEADRHEVKDHSLDTFRRQGVETRSTLGSFVGLYQVHSATLESGVLDDRLVLEAMARVRDDWGWKLGLSTTGPRQADTLRKALAIEHDGRPLFDAVQATWNLLEPSIGPALAEAHAMGLRVIVKEAMANGRLAPRNHDPAFATNRQILRTQADRLGTTLDALALSAVLNRPWVDLALSGASTCEQLASNLGAREVAWDDEAESALASIRETPEAYWSARSRLAWN